MLKSTVDRAMRRRCRLIGKWGGESLFRHRFVRSITMACVGSKDSIQVDYGKDDEAIRGISCERVNQPFSMRILRERPWDRWVTAYANRRNTTAGGIAMVDEVVRRFIRKGLGHLASDPLFPWNG